MVLRNFRRLTLLAFASIFYKHKHLILRRIPSNFHVHLKNTLFSVGTASGILLYASNRPNDGKELFYLAKFEDPDELKRLLKSGTNPNIRHEFGWTALHVAVINRNEKAVRILLNYGADPNVPDNYTNVAICSSELHVTPMRVYQARSNEFSSTLSASNNFKGFTPLHYAVLNNDQSMVDLLISKGADPLAVNEAGFPPSAYALPVMQEHLRDVEKQAEVRRKEYLRQQRKLNPMETLFKEKIIGQEAAINTVAAALRRKENGWCSEDKPLVFMFLGSSGVGKTELAKQIARYIHGEKYETKGFVRIDMSEYQEKHEVAKFIGAPPGYVGYQEGGQLTEALRKCPNAVVLLDEVDKAHSDVLTIMLQLFDEGRLTDGKGKTIDGRNAIYVMTSNLANDEIADYALQLRESAGTDDITVSKNFKDKVVKPILKRHFRRDEFLGRINEFVYFLPFTRAEIIKLITKELEFWATQAKNKHDITMEWDKAALDFIADAYDVTYGARSLKHEVDRSVMALIATAHERDLIGHGSKIRITAVHDKDQSHIKIQKVVKGLMGNSSYEDININTVSAEDKAK